MVCAIRGDELGSVRARVQRNQDIDVQIAELVRFEAPILSSRGPAKPVDD
jgi:hypothetical protein